MIIPELDQWHRLPTEQGPNLTEVFPSLAEAGIRNFLVVHNPLPAYLPGYYGFKNEVEQLELSGRYSFTDVQTLPNSEATTHAIIQAYNHAVEDNPDTNTAILAIGGDGITNAALEAARVAGGLALGLVAAGHKCDLAHNVLDDASIRNPSRLLTQPIELKPISPLDITIESVADDQRLGEEAKLYIQLKAYQSFSEGLSAKVAGHVNRTEHRKNPFISIIGRDLLDKLATIRLSMPDKIASYYAHHGGAWIKTAERTIANTGTMAGQLHPDVEFDRRMARVFEAHNTIGAWALTASLLLKMPVGTLMPEQLTHQIFAPNGLHYQYDGESGFIPATDGPVSAQITVRKQSPDVPSPKLIVPAGHHQSAHHSTKFRPQLEPWQKNEISRLKSL